MRLRQQVGRAHRQKEPGVEREDVAEAVLGDRDQRADHGADERCERVGTQPAQCLPAVVALKQDEADRVHAIGEVVADDGDEDK